MPVDRRRFVAALASLPGLGALGALLPPHLPARGRAAPPGPGGRSDPAGSDAPPSRAGGPTLSRTRTRADVDPRVEVDASALRANVRAASGLAGGRPVWAVVKNGAYGHGLAEAGRALAEALGVTGLAVVKAAEALALRAAGVEAPVLHMGYAAGEAARELVERGVHLSAFQEDDPERLGRLAREAGRPVAVHVYLDTGMSRMGIPAAAAGPWLGRLAAADGVEIRGSYTTLVEMEDHDPVQLRRFRAYAGDARRRGVDPGALHVASTHPLFHLMPEAGFDRVRPGLALYGAYPAGAERERAELTPALRLSARVVRTERLAPGDGVSYGRGYVADREVWVATLPVGHADGYPRSAVEGCRVLIGGRTYPVIGAVSASHTVVEVGSEERVRVGDRAVLVGPDHPDVHPNAVAEAAGISVYDVLMHLGADLPRRVT